MSLFDGSGGFPLAGAMHGIMPVYASEIEPYPIAVSKSHFPYMKHLGSVTEIHGAELNPVDVVTFGSPCQDLSVAGLQKGIHDGERSNLFFEAVRIIKELRAKDARIGRANKLIRPRFAVWENVPGAYSSNKGHDFQAVLQALAEIADPDVSIPFPEKGKWTKAGCIVGDGWSIAWRTLDAQFCGVPQRRKRIYLVADFGSERAGEILFERTGVPGNSEPGAAQGQGIASDSEGGAGRSGDVGLIDSVGGQAERCWIASVASTLKATHYKSPLTVVTSNDYSIPNCAAFMGGQGAQAGSVAYSESCSPTLRATESGSNQVPDVVYPYCKSIKPRSAYDATVWKDAVVANTLNTFDRGESRANELVVETGKPPRKWIVRRLMPVECARLQGFPDCWGVPEHKDSMTQEEMAFWESVRKTHCQVTGKTYRPMKTMERLVRWYNNLHTDSAEYKMWGNGIALPCAAFVLGKIAEMVRSEREGDE